MTISALFEKIIPFAKPHRSLIAYTLVLTLVGSFAAQVNAFILKYTVDTISVLLVEKKAVGARVLSVKCHCRDIIGKRNYIYGRTIWSEILW